MSHKTGVFDMPADDVVRLAINRGRHSVLIDASDFELVGKNAWSVLHGHNGKLYAYRISGQTNAIYMHRLIAETPTGLETDHINGNGLDNRRANLRHATASQNRANLWKPRRPDGSPHTSIYKGVTLEKRYGHWVAKIKVAGKCRRIGDFDTQEEAARAYDAAAFEAWGEFARLNFPGAHDADL